MLQLLDYFGIIVFAITGGLVAARRHVDIIGFMWLATITGIGGGTVRDLILNRPVFWVDAPLYLILCLLTGAAMFFTAHHLHRHFRLILWCDALGLAVFAVIGTEIAQHAGAPSVVCVLMGVMTATLGGIMRDLLAGVPSLILRREIYVTAAVAGSMTYLLLATTGLPETLAAMMAMTVGFSMRACALLYRLKLPGFNQKLRATQKEQN
jgi:uncharacterized membrane protein YeiH